MSDRDFYGDNILALVFKVKIYIYGKKYIQLNCGIDYFDIGHKSRHKILFGSTNLGPVI